MKSASNLNSIPIRKLIILICLRSNISFAQSTLKGLIDNKLVSIDKDNASFSVQNEVANVPNGSTFDNLTHHDTMQTYFSVLDRSSPPISAGILIPLAEGLAYNSLGWSMFIRRNLLLFNKKYLWLNL